MEFIVTYPLIVLFINISSRFFLKTIMKIDKIAVNITILGNIFIQQ